MAKEIVEVFRMQVPGGSATRARPSASPSDQRGVNPGAFCKDFNNQTRDLQGTTVTVEMTIYRDKSFDFIVLSPPASALLKKAASIVKGSGVPNKEKVAQISRAQVEAIAKAKMKDFNTNDLGRAVRQLEGTARSMGIEITEDEAPARKEE